MKDEHTDSKNWPEMIAQLPFMSQFISNQSIIETKVLKRKILGPDYDLPATLESRIDVGPGKFVKKNKLGP